MPEVRFSPEEQARNRAVAAGIRHGMRAEQLRILLFRGCVVLAILVMAVLAVTEIRSAALQRTRSETASLAASYEEQVCNIVHGVDATMNSLAEHFAAEGTAFDPATLTHHVPEAVAAAGHFAIVSAGGKLLSGTLDPEPKPADLDYREQFKVHVDNPAQGLFVSRPVFGPASRKVTIQLTKRLNDGSGNFAGILVYSLNPEALAKSREDPQQLKDSVLTLAGLDGVIRVQFKTGEEPNLSRAGGLLTGEPFWDEAKKAGTGSFQGVSRLDGAERFHSWRRIDGTPLIALAGIASAEALAPVYRFTAIVSGIGFAAICLLVVSALRLCRAVERRAEGEIALNLESMKLRRANENLTAQQEIMMTAGAQLAEERIKLERMNAELILAKQKAEDLSRTKSRFLANMSHELRTPLNAIIGFSEIIRDRMFGADMRRYSDYASDIHKAGSHLLKIINDVLDVARIEAGKVELSEDAVRIGDIVEAGLLAVRIQAQKGGVSLNVDVPDGLPRIWCDEMRLRQIIINLLSNAVKFTPQGGEVTISASLVPAGGLTLSVTDTGIGMTADEVRTALEIFAQVDSRLAKRFEGAGLGLPLAKQLAELHDGRLTVESVPEVGTAVHIWLPQERLLAEMRERPAKAAAIAKSASAAASCM